MVDYISVKRDPVLVKMAQETTVETPETDVVIDSRESEVIVKELKKNKWTIFVDGKSMEITKGLSFADRKSAVEFAEKQYGARPKVQRIKKPKKPAKKTASKKKASPKKSTAKKPRKPLTVHRHFLIDIRRFIGELGWLEGAQIEGKVRVIKGRKLLEIALL